MNKEKVKLCIFCKHHSYESQDHWPNVKHHCYRWVEKSGVDPVDGSDLFKGNIADCYDERTNARKCGLKGKFWEAEA